MWRWWGWPWHLFEGRRALRYIDQTLGQIDTARLLQELQGASLDQIEHELRVLNLLRRWGFEESRFWLEAVVQAYDVRLGLACKRLGLDGYLESLEGMDRELERLRVESLISGFAGTSPNMEALDSTASVTTLERDSSAARVPRNDGWYAEAEAKPVSVVAVRLVNLFILVLPFGQRARYREEFQSELYELAEAGTSRVEQLAFAARLVGQVWALRGELRSGEDPFD